MGVLNLTPDSFSDGGQHLDPAKALAAALKMAAQGADLIDLGAQSTRPGAQQLGSDAELARLLPVLQRLQAAKASGALPQIPLLSVDTFHAPVAAAALAAGVHWVNDVTGGRADPAMLPLVAAAGCPYVLTHSRGSSASMDQLAHYGDVVAEVIDELQVSTSQALAAGVRPEQLLWDPGLGFAKTTAQNLLLMQGLPQLAAQGFPLLVGSSRKRFIGAVLGEPRPRARLWGTAATVCQAVAAGVAVVRVHDVAAIVQTCRMADALWPRPKQLTPTAGAAGRAPQRRA